MRIRYKEVTNGIFMIHGECIPPYLNKNPKKDK